MVVTDRVYRHLNERFSPCTIVGTVGFEIGSIMLWGGISYEVRTDLVILEIGAINALRYLDAVLKPHVIPLHHLLENIFFLCKITSAHMTRELLLSTCIQSALEDYHGQRADQTSTLSNTYGTT